MARGEDVVGLGKLNRRLDALTLPKNKREYLRGIAKTGVHEARAIVRHRTGATARRIKVGKVTESSAQLRASGAAAFLERGVVPHTIEPRTKKALAFTSQRAVSARFGSKAKLRTKRSGELTKTSARKFGAGAYAVVRSVRHPGAKPQPFLRPAAIAAVKRNELKAQLIANWNAAA